MLKGLDPLLGPELLKILRAMGHGDEIAIVDGNYPAETDAKRLVRLDGHGSPRVVGAVLSLMPLDEAVPQSAFRPAAFGDASRMEPVFLEFEALLQRFEPSRALHVIEGPAFYERVKSCYAIVATSEPRLYANIILRKGVIALPDQR